MILLEAVNGITDVFGNFVNQSPVIAALIVAIRYFYNKQVTLEARINDYADKVEKTLTEQNEKLTVIIQNNTEALKDMQHSLSDLKSNSYDRKAA
ncbi:MAG: hypothetical protein EBX41_02035 [Chitinophagia bacterium]|nr:hypothetical protein [Chitinophagia bacterium]